MARFSDKLHGLGVIFFHYSEKACQIESLQATVDQEVRAKLENRKIVLVSRVELCHLDIYGTHASL